MTDKYTALLFFIALLVSGCTDQTATESCFSLAVQQLIGQGLTNQAAKRIAEQKNDYYEGFFIFGAIKVKSALDQVQIAVDNIKEEDSSSKGKRCRGQLKITVPENLLADANQTRAAQHQSSMAEVAEQFTMEHNGNVFTQDVEYSLKPTPDGKEPSVEIESVAAEKMLSEMILFALIKPTLDLPDSPPVPLTERVKPEGKPSTVEKPDPLEADQLRAIREKQGLEKLNQELLEAEQAEKEIRQEQALAQAQAVSKPSLPIETSDNPHSPSFNCAKATKPTEKIICAQPELSALDVKNMTLYNKAKALDAVATKAIWKASIQAKYACGTDAECIKAVYNQSMADYECVAASNGLSCGVANQ